MSVRSGPGFTQSSPLGTGVTPRTGPGFTQSSPLGTGSTPAPAPAGPVAAPGGTDTSAGGSVATGGYRASQSGGLATRAGNRAQAGLVAGASGEQRSGGGLLGSLGGAATNPGAAPHSLQQQLNQERNDDNIAAHLDDSQRASWRRGALGGYGGAGDGTSTSAHLNSLLAEDSPYLQQARHDALTQSNERGLLNSSMAVQASEQAAIRAALPIAQQDAQYQQQQGLNTQNFGFDTARSTQDFVEASRLQNQANREAIEQLGVRFDYDSDLLDQQQLDTLEKLGVETSFVVQREYAQATNNIQQRTMEALSSIYSAQDISPQDKREQAQEILQNDAGARRFTASLYGNLPAWQSGFSTTWPDFTPGPSVEDIADPEPIATPVSSSSSRSSSNSSTRNRDNDHPSGGNAGSRQGAAGVGTQADSVGDVVGAVGGGLTDLAGSAFSGVTDAIGSAADAVGGFFSGSDNNNDGPEGGGNQGDGGTSTDPSSSDFGGPDGDFS